MFKDSVSKRFKFSYFLSSFSLSYCFLILIMYIQAYELLGTWFPPFPILWTSKKIVFLVLIVIFILSILALCYVKIKITQSSNYIRGNGVDGGKVGLSYNQGSREFILGVLLPVVTTISVPDTPITGLVAVIFLQLILGYFYWHSNELFVNVPLMMIGYSLVVGKYKEKELLLFVKNSQLKSVLGREVRFVPLGKVEEGQLGVLGEESLN